MAEFISIRIEGGRELDAAFKELGRRMTRRWIRGAAGEAANVIRDGAINNARSVGLAVKGVRRKPSGGRVQRRGLIPVNIRAWVEPSRGAKRVTAAVRVKSGRRGRGQTFHWRWLEFGSIHNPAPTPFFFRALRENENEARAAAAEVIGRQINDANNWGKAAANKARSRRG